MASDDNDDKIFGKMKMRTIKVGSKKELLDLIKKIESGQLPEGQGLVSMMGEDHDDNGDEDCGHPDCKVHGQFEEEILCLIKDHPVLLGVVDSANKEGQMFNDELKMMKRRHEKDLEALDKRVDECKSRTWQRLEDELANLNILPQKYRKNQDRLEIDRGAVILGVKK